MSVRPSGAGCKADSRCDCCRFSSNATGVRPLGRDDGIEVVIDYREPPEFIALSEKAKAMYDNGMMNARIAKELGCARNYVTKLLKYWFESRGLVMPDGRPRGQPQGEALGAALVSAVG